jgi:eukaryotic-like serine/threonine-protein kinase
MSCPNLENTQLLLRGQLLELELAQAQEHLQTCAICFAKLAMAAANLSEAPGTDALRPEIASWLVSSGFANPTASPRVSGTWAIPQLRFPTNATGTVGPYRIEGVLGHGGMGVVYRARHEVSGDLVALKTVDRPDLAAFEGLRQEIRFLKDAQQPGIVRVLDHDLSGGDPWFAMELLEGETLADRHRTLWGSTSLPPPSGSPSTPGTTAAAGQLVEVLRVYLVLCGALDFIHRLGIVHCDLKPANVFLRQHRDPVLMDFGLVVSARGAVGREALHPAVRRRGTLPYISPEIIEGQIPDARADLYSLGCMLFESLTGRPPFIASTRSELYDLHLRTAHTPPSSLVSGVPAELDSLVAGLLAKAPQDRIGHAEHVAERLLALGAKSEPPTARSSPAYLFRSQIVGRADSLQLLDSAIEQAKAGQGSLVMLDGESGIGKTFFASEVAQRASVLGLTVVTGECQPVGHPADAASVALQGLRNFLDVLRDACRRGGPEVTEELLGDHLGVLKLYSPALGGLPGASAFPEPAPLPDTAGRERLLTAMTATLRRFAALRPLVLILDDLQWADELTLAFLESLDDTFFRETPLLLLGTHRSDEGSQTLRELARQPFVLSVHLGRLDEAHAAAMVGQMLGVRSPSPALVEFITAQSEGVPFFVAEYLRTVLTERVLSFRDGSWSWDAEAQKLEQTLRALSFPKRLEELVRRRTSGLSQATERALQVAAVLGREFDVSILANVLGESDATLPRITTEAIERGILELSRSGRHRFVHDKFREVIYADLPKNRVVDLHGRSAIALEASLAGTEELRVRAGELARHYQLAGDARKAIDYFESAGERALLIAADADAIEFFNHALSLQASLPEGVSAVRVARWQRGLGDASQGLGKVRDCLAHLAKAAALLGYPIPTGTFRAVTKLLAQVVRQVWRRMQGDATRVARDARAETIEAGRVFERLHRASYYAGENLNLLLGSVTSLNLLEPAGARVDLAIGYTNAAAVCGILPAPKLVERYFTLAARALAGAPDPAAESQLRMVQAVFYMGRGHAETAVRAAEQGIAIADLIGFHRRQGECLAVRNGIDIFAGRLKYVDAGVAELVSSAKRRDDRQLLCWGLTQKLECLLIRGEFEAGRDLFKAMQVPLQDAANPERLWALGVGTMVLLRAGDHRAACATALELAPLAAATPPVHIYCIDGYDRFAEALVVISRRPELQVGADASALRKAKRIALAQASKAARVFPIAQPMWSLHQGSIALSVGKQARAARHWEKGMARAKELQLPYHEGRIAYVMSRALRRGANAHRLDARIEELARELELPVRGVWADEAE